jgi:hypothetical protein
MLIKCNDLLSPPPKRQTAPTHYNRPNYYENRQPSRYDQPLPYYNQDVKSYENRIEGPSYTTEPVQVLPLNWQKISDILTTVKNQEPVRAIKKPTLSRNILATMGGFK